MADDNDWVAEVRRWVVAGSRADISGRTADAIDEVVGYEAAHPVLQAHHWPDAPAAASATSR